MHYRKTKHIRLELSNGKSVLTSQPEMFLQTDASKKGWGAHCQGISTGGAWSYQEQILHAHQCSGTNGSKVGHSDFHEKETGKFNPPTSGQYDSPVLSFKNGGYSERKFS